MKATLKKKIDVDFKRYQILGACNPPLAWKGFQAEADIGLLLPCNVVVRESDDGATQIEFMDPALMQQMTSNAALGVVASEVRAKLQRVMDAV